MATPLWQPSRDFFERSSLAAFMGGVDLYAGWPNVFTAVPIAKDVFDKRPR